MTDFPGLGAVPGPTVKEWGMPSADRRLVLVLGPGRSGTSTMAGALAHSGFVVPDPVEPEESNPSGFFEPTWVMEFHLGLLEKVDVRPLDSDPAAPATVAPLLTDPVVRRDLRAWLEARLDEHERLVVKDPRLVWFHELWVDVAAELGQEPGCVIMLRHPSEVSSSRSEFYQSREITAVAGWVNVALMTERVTRHAARALVRYPDLTTDWRTSLAAVRDRLGLTLEPAPEARPHPVDGFIDPALRRRRSDWGQTRVPAALQALAEATFDALGEVADHGGSESAAARLDALRAEYDALHADALDLVRHHVMRERRRARQQSRRQTRRELGAPTGARRRSS
jgi:hypothetical protein